MGEEGEEQATNRCRQTATDQKSHRWEARQGQAQGLVRQPPDVDALQLAPLLLALQRAAQAAAVLLQALALPPSQQQL